MVRGLRQKILAAAVLAAGVAGCAPGAVIDKLPGDMGLPAGAPQRPATASEYPAVHDMPPPRETQPLSEDEQAKLQKELSESRDSQEAKEAAAAAQDAQGAQGAQGDAGKTPALQAKNKPTSVKKKKPAGANSVPAAGADAAGANTSGAKTSGAKTNP